MHMLLCPEFVRSLSSIILVNTAKSDDHLMWTKPQILQKQLNFSC